TSTAPSAAIATAAPARTLFARTRFIHGQRAAAVLLFVQTIDRCLRFLVGPHLYESKTLALAGLAIHDHLSADHGAEASAHLLQVGVAHRVAQVSHVQPLTHESLLDRNQTLPDKRTGHFEINGLRGRRTDRSTIERRGPIPASRAMGTSTWSDAPTG